VVAREQLGQVEDRLLGAQRGDHLGGGIDVGAEAPGDPGRHRRAVLGQALGERVARERRDRRRQRLADEGGRLLARLPDPEVDQVDAAGGQPALRVVEPQERVGVEAAEDRRQPHRRHPRRSS
jgi:hypothetical protein